MKKNLIITTLFITTLLSTTFKILDENQKPIPNVQIFNTYYGTVTDSYGLFTIKDDSSFFIVFVALMMSLPYGRNISG